MPKLYEFCSKCGNNWLACNCENYHPPLKTVQLEEGEVVLNSSEINQVLNGQISRALRDKLINGRNQ